MTKSANAPVRHATMRERNLAVVLEHVARYQPVTRARLAELTGFTKTTVSNLVALLEGAGLVRDGAPVHEGSADAPAWGCPSAVTAPPGSAWRSTSTTSPPASSTSPGRSATGTWSAPEPRPRARRSPRRAVRARGRGGRGRRRPGPHRRRRRGRPARPARPRERRGAARPEPRLDRRPRHRRARPRDRAARRVRQRGQPGRPRRAVVRRRPPLRRLRARVGRDRDRQPASSWTGGCSAARTASPGNSAISSPSRPARPAPAAGTAAWSRSPSQEAILRAAGLPVTRPHGGPEGSVGRLVERLTG